MHQNNTRKNDNATEKEREKTRNNLTHSHRTRQDEKESQPLKERHHEQVGDEETTRERTDLNSKGKDNTRKSETRQEWTLQTLKNKKQTLNDIIGGKNVGGKTGKNNVKQVVK